MTLISPLTMSYNNRVHKLNDFLLYISQVIRLQGTGSISFWGSWNVYSFLTFSGNMHALCTYIFLNLCFDFKSGIKRVPIQPSIHILIIYLFTKYKFTIASFKQNVIVFKQPEVESSLIYRLYFNKLFW